MPISGVMITPNDKTLRPKFELNSLLKASLLVAVVSIFGGVDATAQQQQTTPSFNYPAVSPQASQSLETFGQPKRNFYDFAFEPMPESQTLPAQAMQNQTSSPQVQLNTFNTQGLPDQQSTNQTVSWSSEPHQPQVESQLTLPTVPPIFADPINGNGFAGSPLLSPYQARAAALQGTAISNPVYDTNSTDSPTPVGFRGWWANEVAAPVGIGRGHVVVSVDTLIEGALRHSPHIQVAATAPHIFQNAVFEASSEFDWARFLESTYDSQNDPIGNTLTTGNNDSRFRQQEWFGRGGFRRDTRNGGEIEVSQRLGHLDNNSRFLVPRNQGSSRLELNFRQPILNGRGLPVNQSLIVLADIDFRSASDDFLRDLQLHLVTVTEAYWELVRARAVFLQRKKLLFNAEDILQKLEGRSEVDSLQRQILRAKAAVAQRRSEIARSLTAIKNAQSQLRLLVNSPDISATGGLEFTPTDLPVLEQSPLHIELADVMSTALTHRPEISKAIRDLRASNVRLGVARNDLLPRLDMIVGTYVAGLDANSDIFDAWTNQFTRGAPGFNVGFEYEIPIGNRAAQARRARREWEVTRSLHLFRQTVETSLTEVEVAAREVETTYQEMLGRYHSMVAAEKEMSYLVDRWETLPELDDSVTLLLEDLLDSQERLADEESAFVSAQVQYSISIVRLKQTMGTLFRVGQ